MAFSEEHARLWDGASMMRRLHVVRRLLVGDAITMELISTDWTDLSPHQREALRNAMADMAEDADYWTGAA